MAGDDKFREMFFEEARELLLSLEEGLMELERKQGDRAHLDKTFRAAHSIKGAAAMVGLAALADFTHHIESVLDRVRNGSLLVDSYVIGILLEARDHLAAAVEAEAAGAPIPAPAELVSRLNGLMHDRPRTAAEPPQPPAATEPPPPEAEDAGTGTGGVEIDLDFDDLADVKPPPPKVEPPKPKKRRSRAKSGKAASEQPAVPDASVTPSVPEHVDTPPPPSPALAQRSKPKAGEHEYRITLIPGAEVLRRGVNLLGVLDELGELGSITVQTDPDQVPPLDELDPERCYLSWAIDLISDAPPERLDDVFLFVADDSAVTIEKLEANGKFVPIRQPDAPVAQAPPTQVPPPAAAAVAPAQRQEPAPTLPANGAKRAGEPQSPAAVPPQGPPPPPVSRPAPAPGAGGGGGAPQSMPAHRPAARIRVDAGQLDDLVGLAGELAVLSDNLQGIANVPGANPWMGTLEALDRVSRLIRDTTLELRMVPVEELFSRFPRVVRDLGERSGKEIELRIEGQETRLDRTIVERLSEPMIHLIRNAVDHGLETPDERLRAGKPRVGRIMLWAGHEGDRVALRIEEDGRGLDRERIVRKGIANGLVPIGTSADDPRVDTLIFEPGFSTRDQVSELSGRGVGLDVVRDAVRGLRGSLAVESAPGKGTAFIFRLPLTLALIDGLLVDSGGGRYVVPLAQVEECVALNGTQPALSKGRPCVSVRGELVPMVSLRKLFGSSGAPPARQELLLTRHSGQRVGVAVDHLLGRVQAVIQGLGEGLHGLGRFSGATILADGSVSLILDLAALVAESRAADNHSSTPRA